MVSENEVAGTVVSIFDRKKEIESSEVQSPVAEVDFETVMRKNQEIRERMKRDRLKANRSVLRSYRLK